MRQLVGLLAIAFVMTTVAACTRVPAGEEGVRIEHLGQGSGVRPDPVRVGWHFTPPGTSIEVFPLYEQNYEWVRTGREDDRFTVKDRNGLDIHLSIGLKIRVDIGRGPQLYEQFRSGLDGIVQGRIRNVLRDTLNTQSSTRTAEEIYGEGRSVFLADVRTSVIPQLEDLGLREVEIYLISLGLPPSVEEAIDLKVQAEQNALRRQNEVATTRAEADMRRAQAEGEADARTTRAEAEAAAIRLVGEALSENPAYLQTQTIEAWQAGGSQVPQTLVVGQGGAIPFLDLERRNR